MVKATEVDWGWEAAARVEVGWDCSTMTDGQAGKVGNETTNNSARPAGN